MPSPCFNSRSAGKIHFHCSHLALVSICFNSRSAGKIHWAAIDRHARRAGVSIPAVRVRYIYIGPEMEDANGVSIPAVRVRYIETYVVMEATKVVSIPAVRVRYIFGHGVFVTVLGRFNSRSAGKIHCKKDPNLMADAICFNSRSAGKIHCVKRFHAADISCFNSRSAGKIHLIVCVLCVSLTVFQFPQCG